MATLVLRNSKGSPLTFAEVDANFTNLNNELATKTTSGSIVNADINASAGIVASKLNLAGVALPSDATGVTATAGDNDTSLATTAFVYNAAKFKQLQFANVTTEQIVSTSGWIDATGYSVTITPSSTAARILLMAIIPVGTISDVSQGESGTEAGVGFRLRRGSTTIRSAPEDATGAYDLNIAKFDNSTASTIYLHSLVSVMWVDSPNTTSATTYTVQVNGYNMNVATTQYVLQTDDVNGDAQGSFIAVEVL